MRASTSTTSSSTTRAWQGTEYTNGDRGQMDSRSGFEITEQQQERPDKSLAVVRAGAGSVAWKAAHDAHRDADSVGHGEVYELAREWVATLGAVGALMRLVSKQVAGYADSVGPGRRVYDDERAEDPRELLDRAAQALDLLSSKVMHAAIEVNLFWSLIGRIGVEDAPAGKRGTDDGAVDAGVES